MSYFFEPNTYFNIRSHYSQSDKDFMHFLVQEHSVDETASLDITNLNTLPSKHG